MCVSVCEDKLEVRYKLDGSREVEVMRSRVRNLANGRLHSVSIRRLSESVSMQVNPPHTHTHTHTHTQTLEVWFGPSKLCGYSDWLQSLCMLRGENFGSDPVARRQGRLPSGASFD